MPAAKFDIVLEEHSNLTYDFTYLDENDNAVDVSNYGATIVFAKDRDSKHLFKGTNVDGWIQIGGSNGKIILNVPYTAYQDLTVEKGIWELYIYPTSGDITDRPRRFIKGKWVYSRTLL